MKLLTKALFVFALIALGCSVNIRQEQAAVQAQPQATAVQTEAKVENAAVETTAVAKQEEETAEPVEAKKANDEEEDAEAAEAKKKQEEEDVETSDAKKKQDDEEETTETAEAKKKQDDEEETTETAEAKKKQEEGEEEVESAEAKKKQEEGEEEVESAEAKKNQEDGEDTGIAEEGDVASTNAKKQATAEKTVEVKQAEPATSTLTVLTPEGTAKQVIVSDASKDLDNARNCQKDNLNNPHIQLCANLSCDECLNSDVCGWCGESAQCLPGNTQDAACPGDCLNHWFFHDKSSCPRQILSGSLSNVAPEATTLVNPELATPKVRTVTVEQNEAKLAVNVVVGQQTTTVTSRANPGDGIVDTVTQTQTTPIVQDMVQKAPLDTVVTEQIHDLATGQRLDA